MEGGSEAPYFGCRNASERSGRGVKRKINSEYPVICKEEEAETNNLIKYGKEEEAETNNLLANH